MLGFISRRGARRRLLRNFTSILLLVLLLDLWIALNRYKTFVSNLAINTVTHIEDLPPKVRNQKVYIVAQFWVSAEILVDYWADALVNLINTLGHENVYVSILHSGSHDNTDDIIRYMDEQMLAPQNVPRSVVIDPTTHEEEIAAGPTDAQGNEKEGWIYTGNSYPPGQKEIRRIPYLSRMRNRGLEPLQQMYKEHGQTYDKILYLNDVMFKPSDVLSLLATNAGKYDVACAFDFQYPPKFYDTFAVRDDQGHPAATTYFPFYRSSSSRHTILKGLPVQVKSCWNGMVVADAAPYYDKEITSDDESVSQGTALQTQGLRYRGLSDSLATLHVEASECCLIHADLVARGQAKRGIYMNPSVRVTYKRENVTSITTPYQETHTGPKGLGWITPNQYVFGIFWNRLARWTRPAWWDMRIVWEKISQWKVEGKKIGEERDEVGVYCMINEMHILMWYGWKHVW